MEPTLPDAVFTVPDGDADGGIVVALSGGLDSTVLLHRLAALPAIRARGLRAVHVHHGLHPAADDWAAGCDAACAALRVPLRVLPVQVARDSGLGLEASAREARHAAFAAALDAGEVLALAHHQDDQAETFLLRALRASGPEGLAAMRPWRRFGPGWMWRPLLGQPRAGLEAWARANGLSWIEDPANADPAHARSLLRHQVMPLLRQRWPGADAALARSATLCAQAADLLADDDRAVLDALLTDAAGGRQARRLPLAPLRALPAARRARLVRAWAAGLGLPPLPATAVEAVDTLLGARSDSAGEVRWADACLRAWRDGLHAVPAAPSLPADWSQLWDGRTPLPIPGGGELALDGAEAFATPLRVHARRGGERLQLPGRTHSHALKHLLQDAGVPPWERTRMPLLSDHEGRVLAAGDRLLSATLCDWLRDHGARLRWRQLE
ncbi:tRNA lysidine(34) synthetase TilS [Luteimonas sp. MC1750]|uniref:tRNA lysidine(34) synthetase TilS n=1 Tax=Luteimonas sp. MC1750 TaxID=2799326 RepID=UPI0018F0FFC0|nr:tRNA lysidine(34) synthetase TilS [Luteimonas sp. MC1750]MBJ6984806.1 tRNA lysidine(34) synthetase TilS [Luteimonas sp. MC1750]QQO07097.1 tRNA lysidine(34) synthetase TilS [Luteimonas sp. MC1750]